MRNVLLAGASALALTLGGCSYFQHDQGTTQSSTAFPSDASANAKSTPAPASMHAMPSDQSSSQGTTATAANNKTQGSGSSHHTMHSTVNAGELKMAQQKLKDDGDYKGDVDGKFGPMTAQAVKSYQQKNGLHQTGRLDHATLTKLGVGATTGSGSSSPATGTSGSTDTTTPPSNGNMNQPAKPAGGSL
jgi:peptidoglycan hydrolase-like protein with peptidoglycan-binding domain